MNFHKRLRKLISDSGLTNKAVADACSVTYQSVQQWAKDDGTYPKIENLEPLAGVLKTTPWYLLFGIHAGGEAPIKGGLPPLSDEADELIQCVIRFDKAGELARKTFALHTALLLLAFEAEHPEYAQAGLDMPSLTDHPAPKLDEAEQHAREVLARDQPSGVKHAVPKRRGS
jgi:transcriptional regulator with XRE-family HTH domain